MAFQTPALSFDGLGGIWEEGHESCHTHTLSLRTMFATSGTQEGGNLATDLQGLPWGT